MRERFRRNKDGTVVLRIKLTKQEADFLEEQAGFANLLHFVYDRLLGRCTQ
jgi:hypothetical protein